MKKNNFLLIFCLLFNLKTYESIVIMLNLPKKLSFTVVDVVEVIKAVMGSINAKMYFCYVRYFVFFRD